MLRAGTLEEGAEEITRRRGRTTFPDDWRIYARSAGDDKGPIQAFVSAMDAIGGKPAHNIKVILHGEEEGGGPALDHVIKNHADKLRSDVLIIVDGPQHPSGKPTIYYGARGGAGLEVTVYTAKSAMHSGNYGNWLPDANVRLSQLLVVDGRADRQGRDRRLLRRCAAVSAGGGEDDAGGAGRQRRDAAAVRPGIHRRRRLVAAGRIEPAQPSAST